MKRKKLISIVAAGMVFFLILTLILSLIPATVFAASSSEIQEELNSLESQAQEIQQAKNELAQQQASNASDTLGRSLPKGRTLIRKSNWIHDEIDNLNAQIQTYNQLIAEKQKELDDAQARQTELNQQYRVRIRTMEESGKISYCLSSSGPTALRICWTPLTKFRRWQPTTRQCWRSWIRLPRRFKRRRPSLPKRSPSWMPKKQLWRRARRVG